MIQISAITGGPSSIKTHNKSFKNAERSGVGSIVTCMKLRLPGVTISILPT